MKNIHHENALVRRRLVAPIAMLIICGLAFATCKDDKDIDYAADAGDNDDWGHSKSKPSIIITSPEANLCSSIATVMCYNLFECCTGFQIEKTLGVELSTNEGECRRDLELICNDELSYFLHTLTNGTVNLDMDQAVTCLEALLVDDQCFPFILGEAPHIEACNQNKMYSGQQTDGEECLSRVECAGEAFCEVDRACYALPSLGEACRVATGCQSGSYCDNNDEGELNCLPYKILSETCSFRERCSSSLFCDIPEDEFEGTCADKKTIGEICDDNEQCDDKSFCLSGTCGDGRTCDNDYGCQGYCAESSNTCVDSSDCNKLCADSGNYCNEDVDCGGACETSENYCNEDSDCGGTCDIIGGYCNDDWDCNTSGLCEFTDSYCNDKFDCDDGTCSNSGYSCDSEYDCDWDEECIPIEECIPDNSYSCILENCIPDDVCETQSCIGASECSDRTCAESYGTLDYCQLGLSTIDYIYSDYHVAEL